MVTRRSLSAALVGQALGTLGCSFPLPAAAVPANAGLPAWYACTDKASGTEGARKAEELGGVLGYEEFLIETCGHRPVSHESRGVLALSAEDCRTLHEWSRKGICTPGQFAFYQEAFMKQLDPQVFDLKKFTARCELNASGEQHEGLAGFRAQVCRTHLQPRQAGRERR